LNHLFQTILESLEALRFQHFCKVDEERLQTNDKLPAVHSRNSVNTGKHVVTHRKKFFAWYMYSLATRLVGQFQNSDNGRGGARICGRAVSLERASTATAGAAMAAVFPQLPDAATRFSANTRMHWAANLSFVRATTVPVET
jgi:hypothetical protein